MSRTLVPALFASLALLGCNVEPTTLSVVIGPENATGGDTLRVEFLSQARDVNGDPITYTYDWTVDGEARTDLTGPEIPAEATTKGEVWSVTVTATDGKAEGEGATSEITIGNTLPVATISAPATQLKSTFDLEATATATDVDGDVVQVLWYWTVDGKGTPVDGPIVSAAFTHPGQIWTGHAVPFDGDDTGAEATIEIEVLNGEPVVDSVTLSPAEPYTDTPIVATAVATDPDRQPVRLTYTWTVDGREVMSGIDRVELPATAFTKHQTVEVTVVPFDGVANGAPKSAEIVVLNTPPTVPEVAITPAEPIPNIDNMRCAVVNPSTDTDGDPISYRVEWSVDGTPFGGGETTEIPGDTIPADIFFDDEVWTCTVIPYDDDVDGVSANITVVPVTWKGTRTFTNCDKEGNAGPKQSDCDGTDGYKGTTLEGEVTVVDGIQQWTVPVDGLYRISAYGAQGSASTYFSYSGGKGAILKGEFRLYRGDVMKIAVGQQGKTDGTSAGGGGGTWVATGSDVLMVAGGGGSSGDYGGYYGGRNGCDALSGLYAGRGSTTDVSTVPSYACAAKTTHLGDGGTVPGSYSGNGGGGIFTDGDSDPYTYYGGTGGSSWDNGALGGKGSAAGGFGGGGGGNGSYAAGGGGGYSGGDAGRTISGGGGSFNDGDKATISVGHTGHGEVSIEFLDF